jgi:hypothetical protein
VHGPTRRTAAPASCRRPRLRPVQPAGRAPFPSWPPPDPRRCRGRPVRGARLVRVGRALLVVAVALDVGRCGGQRLGAGRHANIGSAGDPAVAGAVALRRLAVGVRPLGAWRWTRTPGRCRCARPSPASTRCAPARLLSARKPRADRDRSGRPPLSRTALAAATARAVLIAGCVGRSPAASCSDRRAVIGGTAAVALTLAASGGCGGGDVADRALTEPRFDASAGAGAGPDRARAGVRRVQRARGAADPPTSPASTARSRPCRPRPRRQHPRAVGVGRALEPAGVRRDGAAGRAVRRWPPIVDTGDLVDLGSTFENRFLAPIGTFGSRTSTSAATTTRRR